MTSIVKAFLCSAWQAVSAFNDRLFRHGCDFAAWVTQEQAGFGPQQGNKYQPCTDALTKVLRRLPITGQDAILDIGCGKGKAMYLMSRFPFRRVAGYDLSEQLVATAQKNFNQLGLKHCTVFQADAAEFTAYDNYNYFYLFNSLPEPVFQKTMGHICASLARKPRKCTLIYLNPVCHQYLTRHTPFEWKFTRRSWISWFDYSCYQTPDVLL